MSHTPPIEKLFAYRDQELIPTERGIVERHLAECRDCREALAELERQDKIFSPFREARAPAGFADRVLALVEAEKRPVRHRWVNRWAWGGGLALAAAFTLWIRPAPKNPPLSSADVSIYLVDTNLDEETGLGTGIESYFL